MAGSVSTSEVSQSETMGDSKPLSWHSYLAGQGLIVGGVRGWDSSQPGVRPLAHLGGVVGESEVLVGPVRWLLIKLEISDRTRSLDNDISA